MRVLVNYNKTEQNYLPVLQYFLKKAGLQAIATSSTLSLGELVAKAQTAGCDAIFLINPDTLANCVPGSKPSLNDWRGSRLNFSVPCIVGNSLAQTQTVPYGTWVLEKDLAKFHSVGRSIREFSFEVLTEVSMFFDAFEQLKKAEFLAYDIETKTLPEDNETLEAGETVITCCSWTAVYADLTLHTYVLPLISFMEEHWKTDADYKRALQFLQAVNKLPMAKAMHNGMYDATHSIVYNAEPHNWVLDTMALMHAEFSELPKTLDYVASIHLYDYCQWKSEANLASKAQDINRYWAYNAKDTFTTALLAIHYLWNLPAYAKKNYQSQFKLVYPALYCNFEGFAISEEKRLKIRGEEEARLESNLGKLRVILADPNFNPSSPKQVQTYVYDVLGAADPHVGMKRTAAGGKVRKARGTDAKNLAAVGSQHPILLRVTDSITEYREARKAISTYMDFLRKGGRLLWSLNPFGTETGRMACSSSSFWCGTQVQNIPSYAKSMLIMEEGFEGFEIDNSQSEARCTAYLAQDLKLIAALEDPDKDFYTSLGTLFFGIPYNMVSKEFRNKILKKIVHGTNYMMGAATFVENAGAQNLIDASAHLSANISLEAKPKHGYLTLKQFAQTLLDSYHVPFYRVRLWYQEVRNEIISTHKLRSPLGHVRHFFGNVEKSHQAFNSAVAHAPQNLSVSILNIGLWKVWGLVKKHKGNLRIKAQVHDSVLGQYRTGRTDIRAEVLAAMDNPVIIHGRTLRIPVDIKVGDSWGTMSKIVKEN